MRMLFIAATLLILMTSPLAAADCTKEFEKIEQRVAQSQLATETRAVFDQWMAEQRAIYADATDEQCQQLSAEIERQMVEKGYFRAVAAGAEVGLGGAEVEVTTSPAEVAIDQPPAHVQIQQQAADITVRLKQPTIVVEVPEPRVAVTQAEPVVKVIQAEPEVTIRQAEPVIEVSQAEPRVSVEQADPQILVRQTDPGAAIRQAAPSHEGVARRSTIAGDSDAQSAPRHLIGRAVVDAAGGMVGRVGEVLMRDGEAFLLVKVDEARNIGAEEILIDVREVERRGRQIVLQWDEQRIQSAGTFDRSLYRSMSNMQEVTGTMDE